MTGQKPCGGTHGSVDGACVESRFPVCVGPSFGFVSVAFRRPLRGLMVFWPGDPGFRSYTPPARARPSPWAKVRRPSGAIQPSALSGFALICVDPRCRVDLAGFDRMHRREWPGLVFERPRIKSWVCSCPWLLSGRALRLATGETGWHVLPPLRGYSAGQSFQTAVIFASIRGSMD